MQAEGAPVVITYPGGVWGPHDPRWGETAQLVEQFQRLATADRIQARGWLIPNQQLGVIHERGGDAQSGLHACRIRGNFAPSVIHQSYGAQERAGARLQVTIAQSKTLANELQIANRGEVTRKNRVIRKKTGSLSKRFRRGPHPFAEREQLLVDRLPVEGGLLDDAVARTHVLAHFSGQRRAVAAEPGQVHAPHRQQPGHRLDPAGARRLAQVQRDHRVVLAQRELAQHAHAVDVGLAAVLGRHVAHKRARDERAVFRAHAQRAPARAHGVEGLVEISGRPRRVAGHQGLGARRAHRPFADFEHDVLDARGLVDEEQHVLGVEALQRLGLLLARGARHREGLGRCRGQLDAVGLDPDPRPERLGQAAAPAAHLHFVSVAVRCHEGR